MLRSLISRRLLLLALILTLLIGGLSAYLARADFEATWARADERDAHVLISMGQQLDRIFSVADITLQGLQSDLHDPLVQKAAPPLKHRLLFGRIHDRPVISTLLVVDSEGRVTAEASSLVPKARNLAERDYFRAQRDTNEDALFVSAPYLSKITGLPAVGLSRRLNDRQGQFEGVVVGSFKQSFLQGLIDSVELDAGATLWLERSDGTWLAGGPWPDSASAEAQRPWPVQALSGLAGPGHLHWPAGPNTPARAVSYLNLKDWPVRLVLARSRGSIEAAWWRRTAWVAGVTVLLMVGCLGMAVLFERELRRRQRVSVKLSHAEGHLRTILNHLPSLVSYWDRDWRNLFANHLHRDWFGLLPGFMRGERLPDLLGPAMARRYGFYLDQAMAGQAQTFEWPVRGPDQVPRTLLVSLAPDRRAGEVAGVFVQIVDISERKQAEAQVFEEKERFRVTLSSIGDAVITVDVQGRVTYLNPVAELMTGWRNDLAQGLAVEVVMPIVHSLEGTPVRSPVRLALELQKTVGLAAESALVRLDGQRFDIEDSAAPITDRHGDIIGAVMVFHDISEMRSMAIRMAHLAQHDALTGLPNRLLLHERAQHAIEQAQREGRQVAVMYLDLDRFKMVNDSLGHEAGDRLLVDFSRRLSTVIRHTDILSRQGGDEFVVLQTGLSDPSQAGQLAQKLLRLCAAPFLVNGHELNVSASIGISLFPGDGASFDELAKHADAALYAAKSAGRNRFHYFTRELGVAAQQRLQQEQALKTALLNQEIYVEYQPKIDFSSDQLVGVEALVRWRRQGQVVSPAQFIPVAEESGQIIEIGRHVLRTACRDARRVLVGPLHAVPVAVNVSIRQLTDPSFVGDLQSALAESGLPGHALEIEVTESVLMQNMEAAAEVLGKIKALGVRIAIDDFGTGYSSLAYLASLPVDVLKIDKFFVDAYATHPKNMAVITAIIDLAQHLQLEVIAEGVETRTQADFLLAHGCRCMQGYYFSRPLSLPALQDYAERLNPELLTPDRQAA
ncbi:EAL domain-containing protein [Curvibacter sp. HBC61]|uniref:EAL domain-containing protein n=1 Tax=Curvibacter cyanobacteriorum TaxID=3026422 RepID=A0ABT5MTL2_9BURK|nr:EAL domain-containing protein [Curvibacter sp. HBC61]MDD0837372.1 EAL domain-containing protein [Curvibacter sp. HBC61]